jgi:hypothetical protein
MLLQPETSNIARLEAWAKDGRGLQVVASPGTQREPEHVVAIKLLNGSPFGESLISRSSADSIEAAAGYVINVLWRLGLEVKVQKSREGDHR